MKHLFFVAIATGILSTTISTQAQKAVSVMKLSEGSQRPAPQFIDGIEIRRDNPVPVATPVPANPEKLAPVTGPAIIENCSKLQFKYAQLLDCEVEAIGNTALFNFIDEWWGTRYRYGGSTKKGVDCSAYTGALLNNVYKTNLPRTARDQYAACEKVNREDLKEGDLVFFNTRGGISHVGVYLGNGAFTHSSVHSGVTIDRLDDGYYSKKYVGGGRISNNSVATN